MHLLNNQLQEFGRNSPWEEINKQWKHGSKDTSIDWATLEKEFPHPEIVEAIKEGMNQKWQNQMFEEEMKVRAKWWDNGVWLNCLQVFVETSLQSAWEAECMHQAMLKMMPRLKRERKKLQYIIDNVLTINLKDARRLDPELFTKLDAEVDQLNWDDDPAAPETFAAYNKAEEERRSHKHH
jgi:hypothetical protein